MDVKRTGAEASDDDAAHRTRRNGMDAEGKGADIKTAGAEASDEDAAQRTRRNGMNAEERERI